MKILILGATGFIGRRFCELSHHYFPHDSFHALVRNDPPFGFFPPHISWSRTDLNTEDFSAYADSDCVIYLLGRAHHFDKKDQLLHWRENTLMTVELFKKMGMVGIKQWIYVSTLKAKEITLEDNVLQHIGTNQEHFLSLNRKYDSYSLSKRLAEYQVLELAKKIQASCLVLRPPLVYGPKAKGNVPRLIKLCNSSWPLPFLSTRNKRSFIFLDNFVYVLFKCIEHLQKKNTAQQDLYEVADHQVLSTTKLVTLLRSHLKRQDQQFYVPELVIQYLLVLLGKQELYQKLWCSLEADDTSFRKDIMDQLPYNNEEGWYQTIQGM